MFLFRCALVCTALFASGCALINPPPDATIAEKMGRAVIVLEEEPEAVRADIPSGTAASIGRGAAEGALAPIYFLQGPGLVLLGLMISPFTATYGAVKGAVDPTPEQVKQQATVVLSQAYAQSLFRNSLSRSRARYCPPALDQTKPILAVERPGKDSAMDTEALDLARNQGATSVVVLRMDKVVLAETIFQTGKDPTLVLEMKVSARIIQLKTQNLLYIRDFPLKGQGLSNPPYHPFSHWTANDGAELKSALSDGIDGIVGQFLDSVCGGVEPTLQK